MISKILNKLRLGDLDIAYTERMCLNQFALDILSKKNLSDKELEDFKKLLLICNITYNNSDRCITPIEDGVYDLLIEHYRKFTSEDIYPVGAEPIKFESSNEQLIEDKTKAAFGYIEDKAEDVFNIRTCNDQYKSKADYLRSAFVCGDYINKRTYTIAHEHPELVGTFDKCKYVTNKQAMDAGVFDDSNVRIVERDFIKPLLEKGIMDPNKEYMMIAQLKYDGVSVEADVSNMVESARSRGDSETAMATDMTPILYGYKFPRMMELNTKRDDTTIGMKFEAIINYYNLAKLNEMKNYHYANGRTAIIGLTGSSDAYKYRDLITLVPIASDLKDSNGRPIDRLDEIYFLNKYYSSGEPLRCELLVPGNYISLLFQMKRYVEEAEAARVYLPFMYDGVVFEFYSPEEGGLRDILGRDNFIDRYKVAVKFNPETKQTIFREYKYTIGQDGRITPMIYYDPVEFFGTIHPKSSGHSYQRFKELDLHVGDIINVKYVNDVMPYVTKPDIEHNRKNAQNPHVLQDTFPTECPCCGTKLVITDSGKSVLCPNMNCGNRTVMRLSSTFEKLGIKDFKDERIKTVGLSFLWEYLTAPDTFWDYVKLGPNIIENLTRQLTVLQEREILDYDFIGSLGFTGIAKKTWKLIFNKIELQDLYAASYDSGDLKDTLIKLGIKGVGPATIETICNEFEFFKKDIKTALEKIPIVGSIGTVGGKQIRFSGIRDMELCNTLMNMGHDADGNAGVTKSTDILLIPNESYTSGSKVAKAKKYGIPIISIQEFKQNMDLYL